MNENEFEINYEFRDLNVNLFNQNDLNKMCVVEGDNLNNFVTKSILFYILSGEQNHDVITDYYIVGVGAVDLFDITARSVYVFDTSSDSSSDPPRLIDDDYQKMIDELYEHSEVEVIAINIKDLPDDIFQRYLKLREYVITSQ
jgi:hypothetical protein